jgi:MarR family transcriptional regulator, organic hydroperoxide resistance regulator
MFELFVQQKPRHIAMAAEFDLSPMQAFALRLLEPGRPLPMSELAEALHCDASNVTGIVDRLEARGLIARRGADHDRRVKMLVVTDDGAQLRGRLLERIAEPPPAIAALSATDQRSLRDILRRALG